MLFFQLSVYCQEEEPADQSGIDQAEWMAEKDVDNELTSLDLLDFREFKKNRVQINSANAAALAALGMLTPLQIVELLQYREELGPLSFRQFQAGIFNSSGKLWHLWILRMKNSLDLRLEKVCERVTSC